MATDPRVESLRLLTSIDATLRALLLVMSEKRGTESGVPDHVLDGPHGNPIVKAKSPRDWLGDDMAGRKLSECPPAYLDLLAERYDYFATKPDQEPDKVRYAKLDASRARGWSARLRGGWTAPVPAARVDETQGEPAW